MAGTAKSDAGGAPLDRVLSKLDSVKAKVDRLEQRMGGQPPPPSMNGGAPPPPTRAAIPKANNATLRGNAKARPAMAKAVKVLKKAKANPSP